MRVYAVDCDAPPDRVWMLISRPERWSEWSTYGSIAAIAYGPIVGLIARNLARVAERG